MKKIIYSILAVALLCASCEKDGEKLIVTPPGTPSDFSASSYDITLSSAGVSALALTLVWTEGAAASVSDPTVALPDDLVSRAVQFSATEDFAQYAEVSVDKDKPSLQFTGNELSLLMVKLGLTEVQKYSVYVRLATTMGKTAAYSETLVIGITPYAVETGYMNIVDKNNKETILATLRCKDATPSLFEGFAVTPSGWYNCFFVAADGVTWGCDADWTTFSLIAGSGNNCWFAEPSGCQYVYADTQNNLWWQVYIPSVNATVDGTVYELKYSKSAGGFSGTVTSATADASVSVNGTGARYDTTTGTDSGVTGIEYPFALVPAADNTFELVAGTSDATVTLGAAGTYTLTFNVTDCIWSVVEGESGGDEGGETDPWADYPDPDFVAATGDLLYTYSIDSDNNPVSVNGKLLLTGDVYQGYRYFTGWENFVFGDSDVASSAKVYGSAPVSDTGLYRLFCGSSRWNIWFPSSDAAYTRVTVDMAGRSWKYEVVSTISIVGDFNEWSLDSDKMTFDSSTQTWSAQVEASSWGTYGLHFVVNSDWNWGFTDSDGDGVLETGTSDFMPSVEAGAYTISISLNDPQNMTVKFE